MSLKQYSETLKKGLLSVDDVNQNIIGLTTKIQTPFGEMCPLYADYQNQSKPFQLIEMFVQEKIKPLIASANQTSSASSQFSMHLHNYAEQSILQSHKVNQKSHFVLSTGFSNVQAIEQAIKILNIQCLIQQTNNDQLNNESQLSTGQNNTGQNISNTISNMHQSGNKTVVKFEDKGKDDKDQEQSTPVILLSAQENCVNVLPWVLAGCQIVLIDNDSTGNIDMNILKNELNKQRNSKLIVVFISAVNHITSLKANLEPINQFIYTFKKDYLKQKQRLILMVDSTNYSPHGRLDLSLPELSQIDLMFFDSRSLLGGSEGGTLLIGQLGLLEQKKILKKSNTLNQSKPDNYQQQASMTLTKSQINQKMFQYPIDERHSIISSAIYQRDFVQSTDTISLYRTALALELQDWIGLDYIERKESENMAYFFEQIKKTNELLAKQQVARRIVIEGEDNPLVRTGSISMKIQGPGQLSDGRQGNIKSFNPSFVSKVLSDVFGIQTHSPFNTYGLQNLPLSQINEKAVIAINENSGCGFDNTAPAYLKFDIFFAFQQFELDYLLNALKHIALYGEEIMRFYSDSGQANIFQLKKQSMQNFYFDIKSIGEFKVENYQLQQRDQVFKAQSITGEQIIMDPDVYFAERQPTLLSHAELKEAKERILVKKQQEQIDQQKNSGAPQQQEAQQDQIKKVFNPEEDKQITNLIENVRNKIQPDLQQKEDQLKDSLGKDKQQLHLEFLKQPSQLFDNSMGSRSKRQKFLKEIYDFYSSLLYKKDKVEIMEGLNINKFIKFCEDFDILDQQLSQFQIITIFRKNSSNVQILTFTEFLISLETLALTLYAKQNQGNTPIYDQVEDFFQTIGLDNPTLFRQKMIQKNVNFIDSSKMESEHQIIAHQAQTSSLKSSHKKSQNDNQTKSLANLSAIQLQSSMYQVDGNNGAQLIQGQQDINFADYYKNRIKQSKILDLQVKKMNEPEITQTTPIVLQGQEKHVLHYYKKNKPNKYYALHSNNSLKRLNLLEKQAWESIDKTSLTDWKAAIRDYEFQPMQLIQQDDSKKKVNNDDNIFLKEYDLGNEQKSKHDKEQSIRQQLENYGNIKQQLRPTEVYLMKQQQSYKGLSQDFKGDILDRAKEIEEQERIKNEQIINSLTENSHPSQHRNKPLTKSRHN